jgi:hypothetical protein
MPHDSLIRIVDEPIAVDDALLLGLAAFHASPKLVDLPGVDTAAERERLSKVLDDLVDALSTGIAGNPTKLWVMRQFQKALEAVWQEDTEGRDHFGVELERLMDILRIESSDGLLNYYLGGI